MPEDKIVNDAGSEISSIIEKTIIRAREESASLFLDEIRMLREQLEDLSQAVESGYKPAYARESIYDPYDQVKKKYPNLSESAFVASGGTSIYTPEEDSFFLRACRDKYRYSPVIRKIVNLVSSLTLSSGIKIDIPAEEVDKLISDNLNKAKFNKKLKGFVKNHYTDGEIFIAMFMRPDGTVKFKTIDAQEIREIEFHPEDKEVILAIKREWDDDKNKFHTQWYKTNQYIEQLEDEIDGVESAHASDFTEWPIVFYFKYGHREGQRGEMPLLPILRYDRIYEDVLIDLAKLYHERASVVWILKLKGNNPNLLDRTDRPVQGSKIKIETDNKVWRTENLNLGDTNSEQYARPHRLAIAAGVGLSEHAVFEDITNASYASLRAAGSSTDITIKSNQGSWVDNVEEIVRCIIKFYVEKGFLEEEYEVVKLPALQEVFNLLYLEGEELKEAIGSVSSKTKKVKIKTVDLPISVIFPQPQQDNPLIVAQAVTLLVQAGLMSSRTAMKLMGLDPENETSLITLDALTRTMVNMPTDPNTANNKNKVRSQQPRTNYDRKLDKGTTEDLE